MLLTFCTLLFHVRTANILMVFPTPSRSHQILGDEIAKALLKKGHHVTTITPYPLGEELVNHTEIIPEALVLYKQSKFIPIDIDIPTYKCRYENFIAY